MGYHNVITRYIHFYIDFQKQDYFQLTDLVKHGFISCRSVAINALLIWPIYCTILGLEKSMIVSYNSFRIKSISIQLKYILIVIVIVFFLLQISWLGL